MLSIPRLVAYTCGNVDDIAAKFQAAAKARFAAPKPKPADADEREGTEPTFTQVQNVDYPVRQAVRVLYGEADREAMLPMRIALCKLIDSVLPWLFHNAYFRDVFDRNWAPLFALGLGVDSYQFRALKILAPIDIPPEVIAALSTASERSSITGKEAEDEAEDEVEGETDEEDADGEAKADEDEEEARGRSLHRQSHN